MDGNPLQSPAHGCNRKCLHGIQSWTNSKSECLWEARISLFLLPAPLLLKRRACQTLGSPKPPIKSREQRARLCCRMPTCRLWRCCTFPLPGTAFAHVHDLGRLRGPTKSCGGFSRNSGFHSPNSSSLSLSLSSAKLSAKLRSDSLDTGHCRLKNLGLKPCSGSPVRSWISRIHHPGTRRTRAVALASNAGERSELSRAESYGMPFRLLQGLAPRRAGE